ncbi:hypothetical protein BpHYR1_000383 [Brachionus plicatilis]|uniref:Uncharacterized protein n=1 Tax=Brachionus plicatilis TaxID=10195 RepID=A0A3M7Q5I4_BRAPC|nr:hypothetical protein BpHYR1_000383 [Brachionus plicatilis]
MDMRFCEVTYKIKEQRLVPLIQNKFITLEVDATLNVAPCCIHGNLAQELIQGYLMCRLDNDSSGLRKLTGRTQSKHFDKRSSCRPRLAQGEHHSRSTPACHM